VGQRNNEVDNGAAEQSPTMTTESGPARRAIDRTRDGCRFQMADGLRVADMQNSFPKPQGASVETTRSATILADCCTTSRVDHRAHALVTLQYNGFAAVAPFEDGLATAAEAGEPAT
jgi:hypothetical protein